jgi:hypothetical protein
LILLSVSNQSTPTKAKLSYPKCFLVKSLLSRDLSKS